MGLFAVALFAAGSRLIRLASHPGGLLDGAAEHGLLARTLVEHGPAAALHEAGTHSLPLAALIALVSRFIGFDVAAPAVGTALTGTAAALFTALWLRRALGPGWGIAGGTLLAGSFWPLLFSRIGLSPIVGAAALAALLWLLQEALSRRGDEALPWYAAAGMAAAVGFAADPILRMMPLLLLAAFGVLLPRRHTGEAIAGQREGMALTAFIAVLASLPVVSTQIGEPDRPIVWVETPGLPGLVATSAGDLLRGYGASLARLIWPGSMDAGLHLPPDALLDPWLVPWALLGFAIALVQRQSPGIMIGLNWIPLLLLPAALSDPGHPGRLLPLLPLLTLLILLGMRAAIVAVPRPSLRPPVVALVMLTVIGTTLWGTWRYFTGWAPAEATADVVNRDTVAAVQALRRLPPDGPILLHSGSHQAVAAYLADDIPQRIDVAARDLLVLPGDPIGGLQDGWLVIPASAPTDPLLLSLSDRIGTAEVGTDDDGDELYRIYRVDGRLGLQLPLSVPTIPWTDGISFQGFHLTPLPDGRVAFLFAWALSDNTPAQTLVVRLAPSGNALAGNEARIPLPATTPHHPVIVIASATLDIPITDGALELAVALMDDQERPQMVADADDAGFVLLERYRFTQ